VGVEVTEQRDLCAVVDELTVDVEDELDARVLGPGALARSAGLGERGLVPAPGACGPGGEGCVDLGQGLVGGAGVVEGEVVDLGAAEVAVHPGAEDADDDVREPPGDRRDGCGDGLGVGEVDGERTAAALDLGRALSARVDVPRAGSRLPEVLLVGQSLETGAQLVGPVPGGLVDEGRGPVDGGLCRGHGSTIPAI